MTTINELNEIANDFLQDNFKNVKLEVPIEFNGRLKMTLGRFVSKKYSYSNERNPLKIELSKTLLNNEKHILIDVLKHELIHYGLYMSNQPCNDNDNTFIEKCRATGVSLTRMLHVKQKRHIYKCGNGHEFKRVKRINTNKFKCNCGCALTYEGEKNI